MPGDLKVVYLVNSGSEANDLATLMARRYTRNNEIIALRNGYHGMSQATMTLTASKKYRYKVPYAPGAQHVSDQPKFLPNSQPSRLSWILSVRIFRQ